VRSAHQCVEGSLDDAQRIGNNGDSGRLDYLDVQSVRQMEHQVCLAIRYRERWH
jgi:hypothetical protein